jgi:hypothetical protein
MQSGSKKLGIFKDKIIARFMPGGKYDKRGVITHYLLEF